MPSKTGSFPLKLYFYEEFLILKGAIASLGNCVPRFPLILTANFHSLYVMVSGVKNFGWLEPGVGNFGKSELGVRILKRSELESDILPQTPQPWLKHDY